MITRTQGYQSSDGKIHETLADAQRHEIRTMADDGVDKNELEWGVEGVAAWIMKNAARLIDILTTKPNSLPKARKINGGTKRRTPKPEASLIPMEQSTPPAA